ncbi:hypothetical protein JRQ81_013578 [Phrynocephalus forsythii]|uniref:Uncharacterized protein n=1 Tax=Phrynocephalus forsythii TaxID=171643 RepID=A0A9Q0Y0G9_9SAUR|nr:hypothetical protein JRQ81_013578 [Phrynocephalus forsythii]
MIQFCGDLEVFFCRIHLKEFFHSNDNSQNDNTQAVPHYTQQEDEISQQDVEELYTAPHPPMPQHLKKNCMRTPLEGCNKELDLYIECFSHCARTEIINKEPNLT